MSDLLFYTHSSLKPSDLTSVARFFLKLPVCFPVVFGCSESFLFYPFGSPVFAFSAFFFRLVSSLVFAFLDYNIARPQPVFNPQNCMNCAAACCGDERKFYRRRAVYCIWLGGVVQ